VTRRAVLRTGLPRSPPRSPPGGRRRGRPA
jgi:hypothetical protein